MPRPDFPCLHLTALNRSLAQTLHLTALNRSLAQILHLTTLNPSLAQSLLRSVTVSKMVQV